MVGEVDELEEDVAWSISCLDGVMDVEEGKLEEEFVDKPRTTIGTKFSVLHCIRIPFLMWCGFLTVDPFMWASVFIAKLSKRYNCWRILEDFLRQEEIQFLDINCGLFMRLHFTIGCKNRRRTSWCRHSFPGLRFDAGRHLFSEVEKNAALFVSYNFKTLLASFHAASRAPCSCHSVTSWDRSSNFGALGLRSWGSPGQM